MKRLCAAMLAAGTLVCGGVATAQSTGYPNKPIRIIVQFGPGTSTDIIARVVGQGLTQSLGKPVVVENRPGAAAIVGTELGAQATPDGYTLTMAVSSAFGINPGVHNQRG